MIYSLDGEIVCIACCKYGERIIISLDFFAKLKQQQIENDCMGNHSATVIPNAGNCLCVACVDKVKQLKSDGINILVLGR